jgi:Asp-tRNA(Asn)/Glu-tRNA(Gln) amidotransferase A subunit family amidase
MPKTTLIIGLIINSSLTCGGSSGGEGALIALRGSPLGVGTDIGGYAN